MKLFGRVVIKCYKHNNTIESNAPIKGAKA